MNVIYLGQALDFQRSVGVQGQKVEFTFWGKAGANFSSASSAVTAAIVTGTGATASSSQSAANMQAGTWTGSVSTTQVTTLSTTWTRYSVVATVPAGATQIGVELYYTPVGTAGANDWIEIAGAQLAVNPAAVAYNGAVTATSLGNMLAFETLPQQVVNGLAYGWYYRVTETNGGYFAPGLVSATNTERAVLAFPTQMRIVPTCTFTSGGFKWNIAGTSTSVSTLTQVTGTTANYLTIGDTATGTAGGTAFLNGSAATGLIQCSSEL